MPTLKTFAPNTKILSADVNSNFTNIISGALLAGATIDSLAITTLKQVAGLYSNGNSGASATINGANGDRQKITLTANCTLSYSGFLAGQIVTLIVVEDSTGGRTLTLPTTLYPNGQAQSITTTANAINIIQIAYDGLNYLTTILPGFA